MLNRTFECLTKKIRQEGITHWEKKNVTTPNWTHNNCITEQIV